ncbi:MAG TPA: amino acid adenylation domain-containing protein, partial [Jatrophihabitans sp.]|nr:amino acid adenylation domain-containing protein [Jatrophihabitans sp.]
MPAAKFDLGLGVTENRDRDGAPTGIEGEFAYRSDLFDQETVQLIADRFVRLLTVLAADPGLRVGEADILRAGERDRLLGWGVGPAVSVSGETVVGLFEAQVARTPDAPAVVFGSAGVTYRELNAAANQLAHRLIGAGVGPEDVVGVLLPHSLELVAAMLAVLKSGAAYLILDMEHPAERIRTVLADARPVCAIATVATVDRLPETGVRVMVLDDHGGGLPTNPSNPSDADRRCPLAGSHPAYVLYTSGSTGRPKGVVVEHRSVVDYLTWTAKSYPGTRGTVVLHTPVGFDLTVTALYTPLVTGGCVVLASLKDGEELPEGLSPFTFIKATPSHLPLLADSGWEFASDAELLLGGEALTADAVRRWRAAHPGATVWNVYGPTEATVNCTEFQIGPRQQLKSGRVPIGRPQGNARVYVLDVGLHPVPSGVPGELYIAGSGLARGYRGRPGLTAQRFIADPFGPPGSRMYRSGDLARWNGDGVLEFLGRVDDQVKLRGHRVELGEIEAVLRGLPGARQAIAVVREDDPGDQRLVAYLVADPAAAADLVRLRRSVASLLPDYMVPAAFVVLDALPLTVNGKLNRAALPAPDYLVGGGYRAPRTPQEEVLCGIFADVLGVPRVGLDDSFFDLGGHSLLAARLIGRVRAVLGAELGLRALFDRPTVAGLVGRLTPSDRPALTVMPRPERVPLSSGQQRLWFIHQSEPSTTYNVPLVLRLSGMLNRAALLAAVTDLVDRHEPLRTVYPDDAGVPYQQVLDNAEPWTQVIDVDQDELAGALAAATDHVFDLATEPPLRATLFAISPSEHVLLLLFHHIAVDGWSMSPLLRDLAVAYQARTNDAAPHWARLPVQDPDYALWQRELLASGDDPGSLVSRQVAFWRSTLAEMPPELNLPVDRPRPAIPSGAGGSVPFALDATVHAALAGVARSSNVTMFMVLHAGLAALLTRLGAGEDVPIGTAVAGRTDEAANDLVGFFVNTVVLRTDTSGDPSFSALLARVRETQLAALAHQDLPFDQVVEAVNPVRSASRHPLFQVMITLNGRQISGMSLPGVRLKVQSVEVPAAKFDLGLGVTENRDRDGAP